MSLPVENLAKLAVKKSGSRPAPAFRPENAAGKRILIVDDDPEIRASLRKVLGAEGYQVVLAADGREAIEKFNRERIDLVLLDLNLPVNSGWDTFGTLTAIDPLLPIIIITGRQNQSEFAAAAGISALVEKPFNVPSLLQTIGELLAEAPEMRLKRLVGLRNDSRYVPPFNSSQAGEHLARPTGKFARPDRRASTGSRK
jgi:CheY-like chemotaxis protein